MLPPDYLINKVEPIVLMYNDLATAILETIARSIADTLKHTQKGEIIPSNAYRIERLNQMGIVESEIIQRIAETNRMSRTEIQHMFEDAAIKTRVYDDRIYKAAGFEPIPVMQSPENLRILEAGISKTLGSINRLTGTIAINLQEKFEGLLNLGYNKVISGAVSYNQAIAEAADDLIREGVKTFHYASGREISVEAAVRMNVLTGANQTAAQITEKSMREMGVPLVRASAHLGARNKGEGFVNHESWQGRVFYWKEMVKEYNADALSNNMLKSSSDKYPDFIESTGYGDVAGLCGVNCRHSFGPYIEGVSPETYSDADLDKMAAKTVTYNGKEIPYYDATQMQRGMERIVRKWDRVVKIKQAASEDATVEKVKLKQARLKVMDFTKQTGLKRYYARERAAE